MGTRFFPTGSNARKGETNVKKPPKGSLSGPHSGDFDGTELIKELVTATAPCAAGDSVIPVGHSLLMRRPPMEVATAMAGLVRVAEKLVLRPLGEKHNAPGTHKIRDVVRGAITYTHIGSMCAALDLLAGCDDAFLSSQVSLKC